MPIVVTVCPNVFIAHIKEIAEVNTQQAPAIDTKAGHRALIAELIESLESHIEDTLANMNTKTRGPRAGSFNSQVAELNPGECVSKVRPVDPTTPVHRLPEELPTMRSQVRNACAPAVSRAKASTGGEYTVEVGDCIMPNGTMFVVAVVTRTA